MDNRHITFLPYLKKRPSFPLWDERSAIFSVEVIDSNNARSSASSITITLRGPEDILGINPEIISRFEPNPNTNDFEPNYFPFLEFRDPQLLWKYTLDDLTSNKNSIQPWLSLVVISQKEIDDLTTEGIQVISDIRDGRKALTVKVGLLPDSSLSWATAHVQANGLTQTDDIGEFINSNYAQIFSRLFCFRKLEPKTQYHAFLVPNFKATINAAFGQTYDGASTDVAWDSTSPDDIIKLSIFFQYGFSTSEFGDFEFLARRLESVAVDPDKIGTRAVDASLMTEDAERNRSLFFLREGALVAPGFPTHRPDFFSGSRNLPLTAGMNQLLNESLQSEIHPAQEEDPLITFPVYGKFFRKITEIKIPDPGQPFEGPVPWLHELNLDFRNRVLASFGTKSIQNNRDKYLKEAWKKVGDLRESNNEIRKSKAGLLIAREIKRKHIDPLSNERFTLLTSPFHSHFALNETGASVSIKKSFKESGISPGTITTAFRKIAHARIGIGNVRLFNPWVHSKCHCSINQKPKSTKFPTVELPKELYEALKVLSQISGKVRVGGAEAIATKPISIDENVRPKFNMDTAILKRLLTIIKFNDHISPNLDLLRAGVHIDDPMYKPLVDQSKDYFLPGLENLMNNGVTMLQENRRAIEAYMVACNYEFMRTAMFHSLFIDNKKSTVFRFFWDSASVSNPHADVENIHLWRGNLGSNEPDGSLLNLVLCIKGDLIRRYPETIIYTHRITDRTSSRFKFWSEAYPDENPPLDESHTINPIFRARVGTDILCVGFPYALENVTGSTKDGEYYIVLQENSDLPRFGLDVGSRATRQGTSSEDSDATDDSEDINDLSWDDITLTPAGYINEFPEGTFEKNGILNSSSIAYSTYQLPIRIAIHISELLPDNLL